MKPPFQVFLLGTPGCGKSEVFRRLSDRLLREGLAADALRIDDYPEVRACFEADDAAEAAGRARQWSEKGKDGGWVVTNPALWDEVLRRVNQAVRRQRDAGRAVFVEFARPDMVRSIAQGFDEEVRASSLLLYIFCPVEICWERNVRRHQAALDAGIDDHLVSREEMERTYMKDDHDQLHRLGIPFLVVDNHLEGGGFLRYAIDEVVALLKQG
jgi:adenylylsulfate kinase-like enzyme